MSSSAETEGRRAPALEVRELSVRYRSNVVAVDGATLSLKPGAITALVGESGSGKSTLGLAALGLLPETARVERGSIRVGGEELVGLPERRMRALRGRRVGLVPQDPALSLSASRTVGAQFSAILGVDGVARGERRAHAARKLDAVGLRDADRVLDSYPSQLSGGMKQRVLIAFALARNPEVVIADEATSALDTTVQRQVMDVLEGACREAGAAVLLITHDIALAAERAEHIAVMRAGRILEQRRAEELVRSAEDPYTRLLLESSPTLTGGAARGASSFSAPAARRESIAAVEHLGRVFRTKDGTGVDAVSDVSFTVEEGRCHALVGESGSGKTTTARILAGLEESTSGTVTVLGRELPLTDRDQLREHRRQVQMVHQHPWATFDPRFSARQHIAEPLRSFTSLGRAEVQQRVVELADLVRVPRDLLGRRAGELSGGQRQRIAIARAVAISPRLVILDEPVSAVDAQTQGEIIELLAALRRDLGLSYLLISHDLRFVRDFADSVSVLRHGRAVESGDVRTVLESPSSSYTRELLAAMPRPRWGASSPTPSERGDASNADAH